MSANDYYNNGGGHHSQPAAHGLYRRDDDTPPFLPPLQHSALSMDNQPQTDSPLSPSYDSVPLHKPPSSPESERRYYGAGSGGNGYNNSGYFESATPERHSKPKRQYSDEIPLREHPQQNAGRKTPSSEVVHAQEEGRVPRHNGVRRTRQKEREHEREPEPKKGFWRRTTWVVYIMALIQTSVFIAELVRNGE
jgi:hypothetical protein